MHLSRQASVELRRFRAGLADFLSWLWQLQLVASLPTLAPGYLHTPSFGDFPRVFKLSPAIDRDTGRSGESLLPRGALQREPLFATLKNSGDPPSLSCSPTINPPPIFYLTLHPPSSHLPTSSAPSSLGTASIHRATPPAMHSNIDCAIAFVIERGQLLNVPNIFSAYLQTLISPTSYDDDRFETDDAIARAALVTFERAMDKYPMPTPQKKTKKPTSKASTEAIKAGVVLLVGRACTKKYSAEVAQLRWEYQQAATADGEYQGCSCMSCASLSSMCDRLPLSASEGEEGDRMVDPVRVRRRRKAEKAGQEEDALSLSGGDSF
ncbi:hypothetical protein V8D89_005147 [Ganoderma adspersum]